MAMKYVAAYMMAVLGGNESPNKKDVKKILSSVGVSAEEEILDKLLEQVEGKPTHELVAAGMKKLQSVPSGGGGGGVATSAAAAPAADDAKEQKKEESEEEEEEEDMGFSLFD